MTGIWAYFTVREKFKGHRIQRTVKLRKLKSLAQVSMHNLWLLNTYYKCACFILMQELLKPHRKNFHYKNQRNEIGQTYHAQLLTSTWAFIWNPAPPLTLSLSQKKCILTLLQTWSSDPICLIHCVPAGQKKKQTQERLGKEQLSQTNISRWTTSAMQASDQTA